MSEWYLAYIYILADPANFVPPNFPIIYLSPCGENCPRLECIRLVPNSPLLKRNCHFLVQNAYLLLEMCQSMYKLHPPFLREFILHQLVLLLPRLIKISALILECCTCAI